ncbi:MAG: isoleucine--tRNA ligase [Bacteroidales bacterium]|nr:isoleucine--tRNA ligase [Bacteroidales bacterium]
MKFAEYKGLNLSQVSSEINEFWKEHETFQKSLDYRKDTKPFIFYEGPPSANGMPGIHHTISRAIKDLFCRYQTMQGHLVERKAGWDTHGLPVEISVEKNLGITKDDIGEKISIEEYNKTCRTEVMKYQNKFEELTDLMGYWINMEDPYITYDHKYMETLWWLLKQFYTKGLLYKGYTIQPFSPAAGTGLSSHELNQPGCYRDVKDNTATVLFKVIKNEKSEFLFKNTDGDVNIMAWTTTPWTLLSNTALAVGAKIDYLKVKTYNPYSGEVIFVVIAKSLLNNYLPETNNEVEFDAYEKGGKKVPYVILDEFKGSDLLDVKYEQLLPYQQPEDGDAFRVITGDFVSTEDGTGIVHIAPSFGADDYRVAKQHGIGSLTLVNRKGKFVDGVGEFSDRFVRPEFEDNGKDVNIDIIVKLKHENKLFKSEKYEHTYPHCWRTDKPIVYYPLDSWFIKTTAVKDRMVELNKTINWQPKSTGEGRFGEWLNNMVDWNLSRSRYWGTPLPIWRTEDGTEEICIGSFEELKNESQKAVEAGFMSENPLKNFVVGDFSKENYDNFDPHRPYVDNITLVSPSGKPMKRELDLIDVWFDSGSMPYAQLHYPFENKEKFAEHFPGDFISEGVDQTRGWFYTLHAIATMMDDSVAVKNILSHGLILDEKGEKMSKRKGNVIDPFITFKKYGGDAVRWYLLTNSAPWEGIKFSNDGVEEITRKLFGTLYNTYSFFSLYANVDNFTYSEAEIPVGERPEIDRWILSLLNTLVENVTQYYDEYHPTKAGREITDFVIDNLSNWYVRLNRKRFWGGEYDKNKISAYQTLYTCLRTISQLMAPIAPFYSERLFKDLNGVTGKIDSESVHLSYFPKSEEKFIDKDLEERMFLAQKISSMALSLRRSAKIKVRQPLQKLMIPVLDSKLAEQIESVNDIILGEVNIKEIDLLKDATGVVVKEIKPNFKILGKKLGKNMKVVSKILSELKENEISKFESDGQLSINVEGETININIDEVEVVSKDIPGWLVVSDGKFTVALDVTITDELKQEGFAREIINKVQNFRKENGFDVTDKIKIKINAAQELLEAVESYKDYISTQTLADEIIFDENIANSTEFDINGIIALINVEKN